MYQNYYPHIHHVLSLLPHTISLIVSCCDKQFTRSPFQMTLFEMLMIMEFMIHMHALDYLLNGPRWSTFGVLVHKRVGCAKPMIIKVWRFELSLLISLPVCIIFNSGLFGKPVAHSVPHYNYSNYTLQSSLILWV